MYARCLSTIGTNFWMKSRHEICDQHLRSSSHTEAVLSKEHVAMTCPNSGCAHVTLQTEPQWTCKANVGSQETILNCISFNFHHGNIYLRGLSTWHALCRKCSWWVKYHQWCQHLGKDPKESIVGPHTENQRVRTTHKNWNGWVDIFCVSWRKPQLERTSGFADCCVGPQRMGRVLHKNFWDKTGRTKTKYKTQR